MMEFNSLLCGGPPDRRISFFIIPGERTSTWCGGPAAGAFIDMIFQGVELLPGEIVKVENGEPILRVYLTVCGQNLIV